MKQQYKNEDHKLLQKGIKEVPRPENLLKTYCTERINEISDKLPGCNEFNEIESGRDTLYEQLKSTFSDEQLMVFNQLDEVFGSLLAFYEDYFYLAGFQDGRQFENENAISPFPGERSIL